MSAALVKNKTVASRRSLCFSRRFNRKAAGTRRFTFWRNRTGSIDNRPLSTPLKKNETIQQQKMMNATVMLQLWFGLALPERRGRQFSQAVLPGFFSVLCDVL